jgi:aspartate ammonia-lyase
MGEMQIPAHALYGASTARAVQNFPVSGLRMQPALLWALLTVKKAAARVNQETGEFQRRQERDPNAFRGHDPNAVAAAIVMAAEEIRQDMIADAGAAYAGQFPIDVYQAGAGTSLNMNVNEVLANSAIQKLGGERGDRLLIDPNDHVNMGQSTNDVIPTAMRIAAVHLLESLHTNVVRLGNAFQERGEAFHHVLKSGRTHLQDAVPLRLGQEFTAWAKTVRRSLTALDDARTELTEVGIGGNAVGTGINTRSDFPRRMACALSEETGWSFRTGDDLIELCQSTRAFVTLSSALRSLALDLNRIANDIRLLASGPTTGLAEIVLPPVQPGSSIMPGKVNPSMPEMLNMVCYQVFGCDTTVAMASQAGQLELNVMLPVIAYNLNHSLIILTNALGVFTERCVVGIEADADRCRAYLDHSLGLATILTPVIGYLEAARIVKHARSTGLSIRQTVQEAGLLSPEEFDRLIAESIR